jgi:PAS domain S-box-containing protein
MRPSAPSNRQAVGLVLGQLKFRMRTLMGTLRVDEFIEQIPEAVAVLATDGRIVSISNEFTRLFGYEPDEMLGRHLIEELMVPAALAESAKDYTDRLKHGRRVDVEAVARRKDGRHIRVSLLMVPLTTASGEHAGNYAIYRDISERKRVEERLLESEARFRAIADTAPVMIWTTGTDGFCDYFNKPWLEFTGRTMDQEVGTGWTQGVHPDDLQSCSDGYWPAFHARVPFRVEYRLRRADGEYRWVIESGIPRYTASGEFAGYIGSNIDISDMKRAEEERERLRQLQAELAHMNRLATVGELTASLAHEIKQPLAAAAIHASACERWLQRDVPDVMKACAAAAAMAAEVTRGSKIIDRVRSLYGRGMPQRELVDVNQVIRELVALVNDTARWNSMSTRTELDVELPMTTADRVQLQQVLMNLMLNATEAMKDTGGEMAVTSKRTKDGELLISVSDSGVGIPDEETERIFEAFVTTKPQGTGMGLAISRSIVEAHGGRLWASANTVRGAIFQFTLPPAATTSRSASSDQVRTSLQ